MKKLDKLLKNFKDINDDISNLDTELKDFKNYESKLNIQPKLSFINYKLIYGLFILACISSISLLVLNNVYFSRIKNDSNSSSNTNHHKDVTLDSMISDVDYFNLTGIKYLDLSEKELSNLGITCNDTIINVPLEQYLQINNDKDKLIIEKFSKTLIKNNYNIKKDMLVKQDIAFTPSNHKLNYKMYNGWNINNFNLALPIKITANYFNDKNRIFICNINGSNTYHRNKYEKGVLLLDQWINTRHSKTNIEELGSLSKLIPVRIRLGFKHQNNSIKKSDRNASITPIDRNGNRTIVYSNSYQEAKQTCVEIILWYAPTDEFIKALPERFGQRLTTEIHIAQNIESGLMTPIEACQNMPEGESILGICDAYQYQFQINSIYPNPTSDIININFCTKKTQNISIGIYEVTGKLVKNLVNDSKFLNGENLVKESVSDLSPGVYLLIIKEENGNLVTDRFIKE